MSDNTEKILLRVEFDQSEAIKKVTALQADITSLKQANDALAKSTGTATKEYQENARLIKALSAEQSALNKNIDASIAAFSAEEGSMQQLKKNLILMTSEFDKMGRAQRNTTEGKALRDSIRATNDELKTLEGELGNNTRNVGNYKDAIKNMAAEIRIGGVSIGTITTQFSNFKDGLKVAGVQMTTFNGIMKANVIGIIITGLAALYALFTKFQPVVDKVEQAMAGLGAAFDIFMNALIEAGKGYLQAITGWFKGIYEIGSAIVKLFKGDFSGAMDQLSSSMDSFVGGISKVRHSFDGMGGAMTAAAKAAAELTKQLQDLEDAQRGQEVVNSRNRADVERLILQSKNRSLSEKERLALLDKASEIEKKNFEQRKKLSEDELRINENLILNNSKLSRKELEQLVAGTLSYETEYEKRGNISEAELDKLKDLMVKKIDLESESMNLQEKITNRRDALLQEQQADREKALEAQKKQAAELAEFDRYYTELTAKLSSEAIDKELQALETSYSTKITLTEQEANDLLRIRKLTNEEIAKLALLSKDEQIKAINEIRDKTIKAEKDKTEAALNTANTLLGALGAINAATGEDAEVSKALAIAQATIDTYAGATKAFAQGGIFGFISGAAIIAAGMANIAKIQSTELPKIGGAAAGGGSFMTKGPTMLMVGDNPGGVERIDVTPISGRGQTSITPNGNLVAMAGGGSIVTGYGGFAERNGSEAGVIDYDKLAKAIADIQVFTKITEIEKSTSKRKVNSKISEL